MKTLLLTMALAGMVVSLTGCETLTDTKQANKVRVKNAVKLDTLEINNDIEYLLYLDRPVWLSRYPIPND